MKKRYLLSLRKGLRMLWRASVFFMICYLFSGFASLLHLSFPWSGSRIFTVSSSSAYDDTNVDVQKGGDFIASLLSRWTCEHLPVCEAAYVLSGENAWGELINLPLVTCAYANAEKVQSAGTQDVSGEESADTETQDASGEESGDTGTQAASGEESADTETQAASGEESADTGTQDASGEESGDTGTQDAFGEESAAASGLPEVTGKVYAASDLTYDFLISNFYNIASSTIVYESELNGDLLSVPLTLSGTADETQSRLPQILIYHTHSQEFFSDSDTSDLNTGIVGVGSYLTELLEGYGFSVLHLTDTFDYVNGVLDRNKAYTYACRRLEEVLAENPTIEVMIDLHRDGVDDGMHLVTEINGKPTAMIMFFNGMSRTTSGDIIYLPNENLKANLAFSLQLKVKAEAYYPGFTRKNYIKPYRYNLHLLEKALLIEAGAQTNTLEEVKNAMEPLAALLYLQLAGEE